MYVWQLFAWPRTLLIGGNLVLAGSMTAEASESNVIADLEKHKGFWDAFVYKE